MNTNKNREEAVTAVTTQAISRIIAVQAELAVLEEISKLLAGMAQDRVKLVHKLCDAAIEAGRKEGKP